MSVEARTVRARLASRRGARPALEGATEPLLPGLGVGEDAFPCYGQSTSEFCSPSEHPATHRVVLLDEGEGRDLTAKRMTVLACTPAANRLLEEHALSYTERLDRPVGASGASW